ncbi:MAG: glycosyltransferase family 4 protein [Flavobacterium sp.]|nr:glycosyltransferase family 4 protein [Flavobacterium sp.]
MNILITAPSLNPSKNVSGVAAVAYNIIKYNNHHCYYHYLLGKPDKSLSKLMWISQIFGQLLFFPLFVKRNNIELVHQNLPLNFKGILREYIINLWCRIMDVSVVLHIHGGLYLTQGTKNILFKKLALSLFSHSKQVVVLSELEQELLKVKFGFSTSIVLSNSICTSIFNSQQSKKLNDKPILLYLGKIEKNKGIYELIEALKLLKFEFNFHFFLCGSGFLTEYAIKEFEKILGNDFEYKGVVSGIDKLNVIKQSNIFILPSYFEGLPMALLETMAAGVVPIVTNVGSMKSIIKHGINGLHVEKQNSLDLYEKMKILLSDHELFKLMSDNAKKTIVEHHDISNFVVQLNKIYNLAMSN